MPKGVRGPARPLARSALGHVATIIAAVGGTAASAQQSDKPNPRQHARPDDPRREDTLRPDIVVVGKRGSAVTDIEPVATLDADTVAATGATSMPELLRAIKGVTQSADGSDPIFLLNAQRVSGYPEIGALPPEAIEKIEVLPEQAALKFGFPPTRRVVNFITKRRFRQIEVRGTIGTTTRSISGTEKANVGITRLHDDSRLTLALEYRHTDRVLQSARHIVPDPDILFDALGNVTGLNGGEIDPALSAAAGHVVTVARVPDALADRTTIAGFANGTDLPRAFDLGPYRTVVPRNDAFKADAVLAGRVGKTLAGSISLSAEQSRDHSLAGPATAILVVPGTNPYSPFTGPVLLYRYLTEVAPLRQNQTTTTLHAGGMLRGSISGWRWDFTAALDQKQVDGRNEHGVDPSAANAAIAAGANPFAPLDPSLLSARLIDVAQLRTRTAGAKTVVTNTPIRLPAGKVSVTATVEAERSTAISFTRGPNPFDLRLGRTRTEGAIAIDVPLASKREGALPFLGELSVNGSATVREVSGFGALYDTTYGVTWGPIKGIQLLATIKHSTIAPDMAQQSNPETRVANAPVYDVATGHTELVTLILGGSPDLLAERRLVRSYALTIKPFAKREWRLSATYELTTKDNQTGTVYALTPQTEAILPDLFVRGTSGRLTSVAYRPINFYRERQRALNLTLSAYGTLGKPIPQPPPKPGAKAAPPARINYYGGMGPSLKFSDRLQIRPGTPELDLLDGDTIYGPGTSRAFGYAYGGISYLGNGMAFDCWYSGPNHVSSDDPSADLRFGPVFRLNMNAFIAVHHFLKHQDWTRKMQLKLEVSNLTDDRQIVRDGNGNIPNRFQPDYLEPIGRTVQLSLRKLF